MGAKRTGDGSASADDRVAPDRDDDQDDGRLAGAEVAAERMAAATRRVAGRAVDAAGAVVEAADGVVDALLPAAGHLAATTRDAAVEGARHLPYTSHRRNAPLPNLFDVHPEARDAPLRELGLMSVPVDEIVGTAVLGPAQRGLDFQPLPPFRSKNWEARWQRIRRATEEMRSLPPIDVLRTRDGYWVTDGHNRVAAAKVVGQVEVDADVKGVVLPGEPDHATVGLAGAGARGVVAHRGGRPRPAVARHDAGSDGPGAGPPAAARGRR